MRKRLVIGTAALAAFVLLTGFRGGCGGHHPDPARIDKMVQARLDDALDDVKATDEQRDRIRAVKDRLLADGQALRGDRRADAREMVSQWDAAQPDAQRLHALVDQRIDAMRRFAHQAVDAGVEIHGILTPEQRSQVSKKLHRHLDE